MKLSGMNLTELDKNLTDAEREEWRAIYASYTSSSVISGSVATSAVPLSSCSRISSSDFAMLTL